MSDSVRAGDARVTGYECIFFCVCLCANGIWKSLMEEGKRKTENRKRRLENRKIDMENRKKERSGR